MEPIRDAQLICVSNFPVVSYSGMLPGVLAGQYPRDRMEIDLVRLCAAAGARLVVSNVVGLDVDQRQLLFDDRPPLPFDVLSIGIGSVPTQEGVQADETLLPIKPMQTFLARFESRLRCLHSRIKDRPLRIMVVGGGVGGVEITFCVGSRIRKLLGDVPYEVTLVNAHNNVARGLLPKTIELVRKELDARSVTLRLGQRAIDINHGRVTLSNGDVLDADVVLWATSATAPPLLKEFNLPKDDHGFLLTDSTLQCKDSKFIFAVGDTGTIAEDPTPKAGVFAVRQGRYLWENIHRAVEGKSQLLRYTPQKGFMKLLNSGDGRAIVEYKGLGFHNAWGWKLKDWIDGRFMDKYQDYEAMEMEPELAADQPQQMRCAGCGGKVAGSILSRVLSRLDIPPNENVLLGLEDPDDAAIVRAPGGHPISVTADFFAAPLDDPYLTGRIAALNSASDVFALGADPIAALTLATIPLGRPRNQEQLLYELLAGSLYEFRKMGATLVGGHTIEGPQITIGYTMLASQGDGPARTKGRLREGDLLVLTKPLGSGVLLAAQMQARCKAPWMVELMQSMLLSNQPAASLVDEFDIAALTDITGFGLAGHLLEMLDASNFGCELQLDTIPLLPGTVELINERVESTLAPANRAAELKVRVSEKLRDTAQYRVLFDPQTSGGLLLGVQEKHVERVLLRLAEQSDIPTGVIGRVSSNGASGVSISVV